MRIAAVFDNLVKLKLPEEEDWMRSYKPEELFDALLCGCQVIEAQDLLCF